MSQEEQAFLHLAWEGCDNARDIGGLAIENGGHTRHHTLVRSDTLHRLTIGGQKALSEYGVRTIVDLRMAHELERDPNPFASRQGPNNPVCYLNLPIIDPETDAAMDRAGSRHGEYIVLLERSKKHIAVIFKAVAASLEEGGVLVHCQGGKDRTGIIVALLLSLVGVQREKIVEDFALSEMRLEPMYLVWVEEQIKAHGQHPGKPEFMQAWPETMRAMLDYLDREYGGVEGYLKAAGVEQTDMEQIRKQLIETSDSRSI